MSGFFNNTNDGRVKKMCETLDLIEKSAVSNRADKADVALALQQLLKRTERYHGIDFTPQPLADVEQPETERAAPTPAHGWRDAVEMARNAPLEQAVAAMAVIATRVEQELYEQRTGK